MRFEFPATSVVNQRFGNLFGAFKVQPRKLFEDFALFKAFQLTGAPESVTLPQCLFDVLNNVYDIFDADGDSDQAFRNS